MIRNQTLHYKIVFWTTSAIAVIIATFCFLSILLIKAKLSSELENRILMEANDVKRSISCRDGELIVNPVIEWQEDHHTSDVGIPIYITVLNQDKSVFIQSNNIAGKQFPYDALFFSENNSIFRTAQFEDKPMRFLTYPLTIDSIRSGWIVLGIYFERIDHITSVLAKIYMIAFPVALILTFTGSSIIASKALAPIKRISDTARNIHHQNLEELLPVPATNDEVEHLAVTMNELLVRLRNSFTNIQAFTANASHELRTPLAVINSKLEQLESFSNGIDHSRDIEKIHYEIKRMTKIITDLSTLAKADARQITVQKSTVWLNDLLHEEIKRYQEIIGQKKMRIIYKDIISLSITGDSYWIRTLIANIFDNAIKYSPEKSAIHVGIGLNNDSQVDLWITDEGPGVPESQIHLLTQRFCRLKNNTDNQGSGLGLAIVEWIVRQHKGQLHFENLPEKGLKVTVSFPV